MDQDRRLRLIERYREAVEAILIAIDDLSAVELDYKPANAGWSARELLHHLVEFVRPPSAQWTARQVVHHLADAELSDAVRLRRMLIENVPVVHPWSESHHVEHLHYERPVKLSLQVFNTTAHSNIELLRLLTDDEWERTAHQERPWPVSIETWLEEKVVQVHTQLMQILNAVGTPTRASMNPPGPGSRDRAPASAEPESTTST